MMRNASAWSSASICFGVTRHKAYFHSATNRS